MRTVNMQTQGWWKKKTLKLTKLLLTKITERLNENVTGGTYGTAELVFMYISSTNKTLIKHYNKIPY